MPAPTAAADPDDDPPVDSTGAGDLLVAAYVWADQAGVSPEERRAMPRRSFAPAASIVTAAPPTSSPSSGVARSFTS